MNDGYAKVNDVRLTKAQRAELQRLGTCRQRTFGRARARVQNNLVAMGLARYEDENGDPYPYFEGGDLCAITQKGQKVLKGEE